MNTRKTKPKGISKIETRIGGGELEELPAFDIDLPKLPDIQLPDLPGLDNLPDLYYVESDNM